MNNKYFQIDVANYTEISRFKLLNFDRKFRHISFKFFFFKNNFIYLKHYLKKE